MPQRFWPDAIHTSVYLLNRMPFRVLDFHTPLQTLEWYVPLPPTLNLPPEPLYLILHVHCKINYRNCNSLKL
jgi:hypothetical protein